MLRELNRDALGLLTRRAREYGDFVSLRLGLKRVVLISHPRLVEEVLVTRSHDFRKNLAPRLRSSLGNGQVVAETLRLYPSAWAIMRRQAVRDTVIGGQCVSAGTTVLVCLWVLHRDPRFFANPGAIST